MAIGLDNKLNFGTKYPDKTPRELIESGKADYITWVSKNTTRKFGRNVWFEIEKNKRENLIKRIDKLFVLEAEENMVEFDLESFKKTNPSLYKTIINTVINFKK